MSTFSTRKHNCSLNSETSADFRHQRAMQSRKPRSRKTCRRKHLCDRLFPVCARRDDNFVAISNAALLIKSLEKRCSAARMLHPLDRCVRLTRRSSAPFHFVSFRMLAVNRRVSDRCAGHGRVRSRVVAEEDEVRGGSRGSRRRPDTSCSARPTSTNCLIFRRTRSSR